MGPHIFEWFNSDVGYGTALTQILIGLCVVFLCLAIIIGLLMLLDLFSGLTVRLRFPVCFTGVKKRRPKRPERRSRGRRPFRRSPMCPPTWTGKRWRRSPPRCRWL